MRPKRFRFGEPRPARPQRRECVFASMRPKRFRFGEGRAGTDDGRQMERFNEAEAFPLRRGPICSSRQPLLRRFNEAEAFPLRRGARIILSMRRPCSASMRPKRFRFGEADQLAIRLNP